MTNAARYTNVSLKRGAETNLDVKFARRFYLSAFVLAACASGGQLFAQDLEQDFSNLLDRCRTSIEMSAEFDSYGLQSRSVAERHLRDWGSAPKYAGWMDAQSEMYVVLTDWTSRDGQTRRLCNVYFYDEKRVLSKTEQSLLLERFRVTRDKLIGLGTHKVDEELSSIPPLVNSAFLLSERNPSGCSVTTMIAFSPDGTFFSAGTGEQATESCAKN
ncbi:hypothetical protein GVY41_06635 [Frigidibacter albus]|uniref:hypothetical protein n=1 Tax=Frigidibacter albus TaxID=1465486 RepID=UPI001370E45F|nr:hypothetical protein [Frigidibacter albus]NBE30682.1 hypothetical protein [Frigidibacter albus]